ncbi:MAG TPA: head-tail adaptor protein [Thermomicrobiales bacterium]|nr:head-tail adaptor protein [Thermomicrobiales bacterium]HRA32727.1 head-tail adaptor protein [Thermomicrobiales bacterium]
MGLRSIVDPRLTASLTTAGHYPQSVTVQRATRIRDAYGEPAETWVAISGMSGIAAAVAPTGGTEVVTATGAFSDATDTILLPGEYPTITADDRVTDVAGRVWDILTIDIGPFGEWTNLACRVRTVGA